MKKFFFLNFIFLFFCLPVFASTYPWSVKYPTIGGIVPPVFTEPNEILPEYIDYIYKIFSIVIVILAFFSLIIGGIIYFLSFGNVGKLAEAKEMIFGAFVGVLILFSTYFILRGLRKEFVEIKTLQLKIPFDEIEEGVWLCPEEMRVQDRYLSTKEKSYYLTFENYLLMREIIKRDWIDQSLDFKIEKTVSTLINEIRQKCSLVSVSGETPPDFRRPKWVYIVGNYGTILHVFPNFKGYCIPFFVQAKPKLDGPNSTYNGVPADEVYRDLVLSGGLSDTFFSFQVPQEILPKQTLNIFSDYLLNYADALLGKKNPGYYPEIGKITLYALRNLNEDAPQEYQNKFSQCPVVGGGQQPCTDETIIELEKVGIEKVIKEYSLRIDKNIKKIKIDIVTFPSFMRQETERGLYRPYSLSIEEEGEWVFIVWGPKKEGATTTLETILKEPHFWCDVFNNPDNNLEDNYMSYFCEPKARLKRYPCLKRFIIFPGKMLKIQKPP